MTTQKALLRLRFCLKSSLLSVSQTFLLRVFASVVCHIFETFPFASCYESAVLVTDAPPARDP